MTARIPPARPPSSRPWPISACGAPFSFPAPPPVPEPLPVLGWRATFSMPGGRVHRSREIPRLVVDAGHEVAVHGTIHRNHLVRTPLGIRRDLRLAAREIAEVTGVRPRWFRPPYGVLSAGTLWAARDVGLAPVLWTAWGRDWRAGPPAHVAAEVMKTLRDRGTVLLHDSDCTSRPASWRSTVGALPLLAAQLRIRGLEVRRLGDHLGRAC